MFVMKRHVSEESHKNRHKDLSRDLWSQTQPEDQTLEKVVEIANRFLKYCAVSLKLGYFCTLLYLSKAK